MRNIPDGSGHPMRRWIHVLLVIVALILLALLISTRATAFVIVPFEQEAEVSSPGDGQIIYVPKSTPFATVTATGHSLLTYFATTDSEPVTVSHVGFLSLDGHSVVARPSDTVPANSFTELFGQRLTYAVTDVLGEGLHVAQIEHKIFTSDSVIRGIAVDTNIFYIVAVDMPEPAMLLPLAVGVALLTVARRRRI